MEMRSMMKWSTVEQLVLAESMDSFTGTEREMFWKNVSQCVITTLRMIGTVEESRFTDEECYNQWNYLNKEYSNRTRRQPIDILTLINLLRRKRIDELDREMNNVRSKLLRLQDLPSY